MIPTPNRSIITADIVDRSYAIVGPGPLVNCETFSYTEVLNGAGQWSARFPHNDERLNIIELKAHGLAFWIAGAYAMHGVIERWRIDIDSNGRRYIEFHGRDVLADLAEAPVAFLELEDGSGGGVSDGPADVLTEANTVNSTSWALDTTEGYATTSTEVYAKYAGESALNALVKIAEHIGENFRLLGDPAAPNRVVWMRTDQDDSGKRAIQSIGPDVEVEKNDDIVLIRSLSEARNGIRMANRIYPYGGGEGEARLTLAATSKSAPAGFTLSAANNYIESTTERTALGWHLPIYREFKSIRPISNTDADLEAAADYLFDAAIASLQRIDSGEDVRAYTLSVHKLPEGAKRLRVGETIRVEYSDRTYVLDEDLVIIEIQHRIDRSGNRNDRLVVAAVDRPPALASELQAQSMERGIVYSAHPQLNANSYTTSYRLYVGEDQTTEKGEIRFWLGDEVVQINQILWRFNLTPIVAFSGTVGGSTQASASGGSSTPTSDANSTTTTTGGSNHFHDVPYTDNAEVEGLGLDSGGGFTDGTTTSGGGNIATATEGVHTHDLSHTHGVTIAAHQHNVDVAAALSTTYGIYRESAGNTFAIGDLEYRLNGGSWANLNGASSLGSDWYELDLTSALMDATTFRPNQALNDLEVRRKTAGATSKTAMLDSLLSVRNIIQSIAFS